MPPKSFINRNMLLQKWIVYFTFQIDLLSYFFIFPFSFRDEILDLIQESSLLTLCFDFFFWCSFGLEYSSFPPFFSSIASTSFLMVFLRTMSILFLVAFLLKWKKVKLSCQYPQKHSLVHFLKITAHKTRKKFQKYILVDF